jgi:sodium transport system permease protein
MSAGHFNLPRFGRLCLKELRESLRDRRTVITLVLMPLLIYPLLSLVLNRVLLNSATEKAQQSVSFGFANELHQSPLRDFFLLGYAMILDPDFSPVFIEPVQKVNRDELTISSEASNSALPEPQILMIDGDPVEILKQGSVDLMIIRKSTTRSLPDDDHQISASSLLPPTQMLESIGFRPQGLSAEEIFRSLGDYEVLYRMNDPTSERALQILERCMSAFNNSISQRLIQSKFETPLKIKATPLLFPSSYSEMLATMIPLVLVLMTMAGAVYPAIDLTAGERERGTMEALVVSPTPSYLLLLAKYSAVVTVSLLTALANLLAMTITLWASGIGKLLFGDATLSLGIIGQVLALLILFTTFFSALLLAITSFARSFKEAQAYLIPVMLLALTPGVLSLLPGIRFTPLLATVPLVNIVLLARQLLTGGVEWNTASIAISCTAIYAATALAVASRLFGSDASLQGSQGSWRDLIRRPTTYTDYPQPDQMAMTMAMLFPLYFVASSVLPSISSEIATRLAIAALVSFVLILGLPVFVAWYRRLRFRTTFKLVSGTSQQWLFWLPASLLLGTSVWTIAHEIFYYSQQFIGTIDARRLGDVARFADQLRAMPLPFVLFVFAITPAVCEEIFFRGFVLGSLSRKSRLLAIIISSLLFGLMHVLTSNVLMVERFLPTAFIGMLLAWVALRTGSIWPGMILHAVHNGLQFTLNHFRDALAKWDYVVQEGDHLPLSWLILGALATIVGCVILASGTRPRSESHPVANETVPL